MPRYFNDKKKKNYYTSALYDNNIDGFLGYIYNVMLVPHIII